MIQVRQPTSDELAEARGRLHLPALILDMGHPHVRVTVDTSGNVVLVMNRTVDTVKGDTLAVTGQAVQTVTDVDTLQEALGLARAYARLIADSHPVDVPLLVAKAAPGTVSHSGGEKA